MRLLRLHRCILLKLMVKVAEADALDDLEVSPGPNTPMPNLV